MRIRVPVGWRRKVRRERPTEKTEADKRRREARQTEASPGTAVITPPCIQMVSRPTDTNHFEYDPRHGSRRLSRFLCLPRSCPRARAQDIRRPVERRSALRSPVRKMVVGMSWSRGTDELNVCETEMCTLKGYK
jgi:hypothetical protein